MRKIRCQLYPNDKRGFDCSELSKGKPHLHIQQVNKKGIAIWENCYLDIQIPASKIDKIMLEVGQTIHKLKK